MKRSRGGVQASRALMFALLAAALPPAGAAPTLLEEKSVRTRSEPTVPAWEKFLAEADFDTVMASYGVLTELDSSALDAQRCAPLVKTLPDALRVNPYSPALHAAWQRCAPASERADAAADGRRLREFLLRDGRGMSAQYPILVPTEADAAALIESLGYQPLYGRYMVGSVSGSLPFVAIFHDPGAGLERQLYFDFLRVWQALQRDAHGSEYPAFLSGLSEHYLASAESAGNSAAELAATTSRLGRKEIEPGAAIAELERLALGGSAPAAFELLPLCMISDERKSCLRTALDLVRPLAERGLAEGMVVMALAADRGLDPQARRGSAGRWLERASKRAGVGVALAAFAHLSKSLDEDGKLDAVVRDAIRKAAGAEHAPAQFLLAQWLKARRVEPRRGETAERLLRRAAAHGYTPAQAQLGLEHLRMREFEQAWVLLEQAAAQDEPTALGLLALAHDHGRVGRVADPERALALYRRAALAGNAGAMRRLGRGYLRGELGLPQRPESAEAWYLSAALFGNSRAAIDLAELYLANTPGMEGRAADGYAVIERLAADGMVSAKLRLASALLLGQGTRADPARAVTMLEKLELEGNPEASFRLGQAHQFGQGGIRIDLARARAHYQAGALSGHVASIDQLARALYAGRGGPRQRHEALDWWQRAAAKGNAAAVNNLAWVLCSSRDQGIRDPKKGSRELKSMASERRDANLEDTFAACFAANGDYDRAIATQREAIAKAALDPALDAEERAQLATRLASYQRREAWFED